LIAVPSKNPRSVTQKAKWLNIIFVIFRAKVVIDGWKCQKRTTGEYAVS